MNRGVVEVARILGVNGQQVKNFAWAYKDYLSKEANPAKGRPRVFRDSDVLALMYIRECSELGETIEAIRVGLDGEDQHDHGRYCDILDAHTPILQEPPDDYNETWQHGILLVGGGVDGYLALARNYRTCADVLLGAAIENEQGRNWGFPVLFSYRHALELYLKILGGNEARTHGLKECVLVIENRHGEPLPSPARDWIIELDSIDRDGTAFRYADDQAGKLLREVECWVNFSHLRFAMASVFAMLDGAIVDAIRNRKIDPLRL